MKVRLMGPPPDVEAITAAMCDTFHVTEVSAPHPCRGASDHVRVYLDLLPGRRATLDPAAAGAAAWDVAAAAADNAGMEFVCRCGRPGRHRVSEDCAVVLRPKAPTA